MSATSKALDLFRRKLLANQKYYIEHREEIALMYEDCKKEVEAVEYINRWFEGVGK